MQKSDFKSIPIWVKFPNLNFRFRSKSAWSKISSLIGKSPLHGSFHSYWTQIAFARICIELNVDSTLPDEVFITYNNKTVMKRVEHAWRPSSYTKCSKFSHNDDTCPLKLQIKQVWVQKDKNNGEKSNGLLTSPTETIATKSDPSPKTIEVSSASDRIDGFQ